MRHGATTSRLLPGLRKQLVAGAVAKAALVNVRIGAVGSHRILGERRQRVVVAEGLVGASIIADGRHLLFGHRNRPVAAAELSNQLQHQLCNNHPRHDLRNHHKGP